MLVRNMGKDVRIVRKTCKVKTFEENIKNCGVEAGASFMPLTR